MKRHEFVFILNPIETDISLPVELHPNLALNRATPEQMDQVRELLFRGGLRHLMEYSFGHKTSEGSRLSPEPLSWKYFVLNLAADFDLKFLTLAGNLLLREIVLGPRFGHVLDNDGHLAKFVGFIGTTPDKRVEFVAPTNPIVKVEPTRLRISDIAELLAVEKRLKGLPIHSLAPFESLEALRQVATESPLFVLGLFAIIEAVLTHKPHDTYDSLGHQVSTKMVLLSRRFSRQLPYDSFSCPPVKLWKALYEYRSCLAHGSKPDFTNGVLRNLKAVTEAHKFLCESVKLLLLKLLDEPDLVADLKDC